MFSFSNGGPGGCDLKMLHICLTMIQFRIGYIYVKKTNWKWIVIQHPKLCLNLLFLLPIFNCKILKKTNPKITAFLCVFILFMFEYDLAKYISCLSELKDFFYISYSIILLLVESPAAPGIYRSILWLLDLPWESTREGTLLIWKHI